MCLEMMEMFCGLDKVGMVGGSRECEGVDSKEIGQGLIWASGC